MRYFLLAALFFAVIVSGAGQSKVKIIEDTSRVLEEQQRELDSIESEARGQIKKQTKHIPGESKGPLDTLLNSKTTDKQFLPGSPTQKITKKSDKLNKIIDPVKTDSADLVKEVKNLNPDASYNAKINEKQRVLERIKKESKYLKDQDITTTELSEKATSELEKNSNKTDQIQEIKSSESEALSNIEKTKKQQEKYKEQVEKVRDKTAIKQAFREKTNEKLVESAASFQESIQRAQKQVNKYKKNQILSIGSGGVLDKGKKNPLRNKSLHERLFFGGNFQINRTNPIGLDLSPQLTYWLLPKWRIGAGGTYRTNIKIDQPRTSNLSQDVHGYRSFVEWDFHKIFLHGEYEIMNLGMEQKNSDDLDHYWSHHALLGVGRRFTQFSFLKGSVMMLYNFSHDKKSPYQSPWIFRFGVELNNTFLNKNNTR